MNHPRPSILPSIPPSSLPTFHSSILLLSSLACLLLWYHPTAHGQDAAVRTSVSTDGEIWAGQRLEIIVELLAPGYFAGAPAFELPDPQGVLLMPPQGSPTLDSETTDGVFYSVQRHRLSAFPTRSGDTEIPPITIRFHFKRAPLDTNTVPASVTTDPIPLVVNSPPGAEGLGQVISARDLSVEETWDPMPNPTNGVPAGSAFTRTVTFAAPDLPGMMFPPFPAGQIDGMGIYTKHELNDESSRGSLRGERRDIITYVCERPGNYTIPAARFIWFDLDAQQLQTNDFPEYTFLVTTNTAMGSADANGPSAETTSDLRENAWWWILGTLIAGALGLAFARSAHLRGLLHTAIRPFRPVHLAPFNPTTERRRQSPPKS